MKFRILLILLFALNVSLSAQNASQKFMQQVKDNNLVEMKRTVKEGIDINIKDELGNTALHWAAKDDLWVLFIWLAIEGADVDIANKAGYTPEMIAEESGSTNVASFLKKEYKGLELYIRYTFNTSRLFLKPYGDFLSELMKISDYCSKEYDEESPVFAILYDFFGRFYAGFDEYHKSRIPYEKSYTFFKENKKKYLDKYVSVTNNLASAYSNLGQENLAIQMYTEALRIKKKLYGKKTTKYTTTLGNLGILYLKNAEYEKALPLLLEAKEIDDEILDIYHPDYGWSISNLATLYADMGRYLEAEDLYKQLLEGSGLQYGIFSKNVSIRLMNLGVLYDNMGDYERALDCLEKATGIEGKVLNDKASQEFALLNNLGFMYCKLGKYEKSLRILLELKKNEELDKQGEGYREVLLNLGVLYQEMGQNEKARSLYLEAKELFELNRAKNESYGTLLNNLGHLLHETGEYKKSLDLEQRSLQFFKERYGEGHRIYIHVLNNLVHAFLSRGEYDNMAQYINELKNIIENNLDENHPDYGFYYNNIGVAYSKLGEEKQGIELLLKANNIFKKVRRGHYMYIANLQNISEVYLLVGDKGEAMKYARKSAEIYDENVINQISFLSESDVMDYFNLKRNKKLMAYFQSLLFILEKPSNFAEISYNIQLNIQGRAVQNNIDAKLRHFTTSDSLAQGVYNNYRTLRYQYSNAYLLSRQELKKRKINLNGLQNQITDLETQLALSSKPFREQLANQKEKVTYDDLVRSLSENEASLDFTHFQYHNGKKWTDTIFYAVYLTLPNVKQPIFINLVDEKQIEKLLNIPIGGEEAMSYVESMETGEELYDLIFTPIKKHLQGINTLHISGTGLLHKVAFHILQKEGKYLLDDFELHYHGTMRDLVMNRKMRSGKNEEKNHTMSLFGNPHFNASSKELKKHEFVYTDSLWATRGNRDGFNPLPETKKEIEYIGNKAQENGWDVKLRESMSANEANFKSLSGQKVNIIHIATHGYSLKQANKINNNELQLTNQERITRQKNPLFRSGLALSGANTTWKANTLPMTEEDGLLTAYEISTMDLFNTDLVVLSACNTGLGDILSGEGVFGLQRAFKTAGVKNTIVSLWEVDDEATRLLMEYFYKNYFEGKTAYESLRLAQERMRKGEFSEPYYWAGFVLIE